LNQSLQAQPDYNKDVQIIETVKQCVFPGATDNELRIFFFKCQEVGVHPLSQMVIPVAYADGHGGRKVSFISTIDHFRSMSEDAGDYDGMDEIEFIGESTFDFNGESVFHPDEAICKVYRKEITRPFVGKAKWIEFYPGDKKGHMWRKMPTIMLGKCAEAQARRLAWPKQLNHIYSPEEMERGFMVLSEGNTSSKPKVSPSDITVHAKNAPTDFSDDVKEIRRPSEDERNKGKLISEKQGFLLYAKCKENGVEIGSVAKAAGVENIFFLTWQKSVKTNFNVMLDAVQNQPNRFAKYSAAAQAVEDSKTGPVPTVMDAEDFASMAQSMADSAGLNLENELKQFAGVDHIDDVLPELQSKFIDYLTAKAETPAA